MKAILEFTLPDEAQEHLEAINGSTYKYILQDFDAYLRSLLKYPPSESDPEGMHLETVQKIRTELFNYCRDNDITLHS